MLPQISFALIPAALQSKAQMHWTQFCDRLDEPLQARLDAAIKVAPTECLSQLAFCFAASEFIARESIAHPDVLIELLASADLWRSLGDCGYQVFKDEVATLADDKALDVCLRRHRRREMMRIVWRDLTRSAEARYGTVRELASSAEALYETTGELSEFADTAVQLALDFHYQRLVDAHGTPVSKNTGEPQLMLVLGMGKLGARELNVSSDIDLIFTYSESGETLGNADGKRGLSNQEFFIRLGQRLVKSLDAKTVDGFVFRTDMRLRPYGQSGPLVMNFRSLEDYYQTQGREWERYAMIKARPVAINTAHGEVLTERMSSELREILRPFTYRHYIDFSVIEALRSMKEMINREVKRKGIATDVKLGRGGIREIEFIVQAFQLIRGGRDERLRERQVLALLNLLVVEGCLSAHIGAGLTAAYVFLRNLEHAIQGYQDRQTQALPIDDIDKLRLAWVMGCADWAELKVVMQGHRDLVHTEFSLVVADPEVGEDETAYSCDDWCALWAEALSSEQACELLSGAGFAKPAEVLKQLQYLRKSRALVSMQASSRERLDQFLAKLLPALAATDDDDPVATLTRIIPLIEAVARRSAYLVLLNENPIALQQLVRLCAASAHIAEKLAKYPALLDELLTPRTLYVPPSKDLLRDDLRCETLRLGWDDLEEHMESLRYFKLAHSLRVAASEVAGSLALMKVSDYLTWIAEVVLEHVLDLAWQQLLARHGSPTRRDGSVYERDFIIVGFGKLGGIELGPSSDLDLVFLHDADINQFTDGERSIDNQSFFVRLGQKIIHILNTQTLSGQLYEVDMRLRPSGSSGLLVSPISGFEKYEASDAWTWEHQALVRARVVAGNPRLAERFNRVRREVLCSQRDLPTLRIEVAEMREKMRAHLGSGTKRGGSHYLAEEKFHLKQDAGGIVDIEFMVQYAVLAWAHNKPELARWTDNIRILETLENAAVLRSETVAALIEAYKAYRSAGHRKALKRQSVTLSGDSFAAERQRVEALWSELIENIQNP
jgi:glutamate-ammonia-ligase adenylyltransferase